MADGNPPKLFCAAGLLLLGCQAISADEPDEPLPSLEFLEYLGEWQDDNGQLLDPMALDDTKLIGKNGELEGERK